MSDIDQASSSRADFQIANSQVHGVDCRLEVRIVQWISYGCEVPMQSVKRQVQAVLDQLPEDCTIEQVQYQLYMADLLARRARMSETSELIAHDAVVKRFAKWRSQPTSRSSGSPRRSQNTLHGRRMS